MKKLLVSALALGALTSVAMAGEPVKLSSAEMDKVTAGLRIKIVDVCTVCTNIADVAQANVNTSVLSKVRQRNVAVVEQEIN
jgi:hypothetical protein